MVFICLSTVGAESSPDIWKLKGLLSALNDENKAVRWSALKFLFQWEGIEELISRESSRNMELISEINKKISLELMGESGDRESAAKALGIMGESAAVHAPALVKLLKDKEPGVRENAAEALGNIGESISTYAPALIQLLRDEDHSVRRRAAESLGKIGGLAAAHVPVLAKLLKDDNSSVRGYAVEALGRLGEPAEVYVPTFIKLLKDKDLRVRINAANALGKMKPWVAGHAPALIELLRDDNWNTRESAIMALGKIGALAPNHAPALIELLKDKNPGARKNAAEVLGKMGASAAAHAPALVKLFRDNDPDVRENAAQVIGKVGVSAGAHVPALIELLRDNDPEVRGSATEAVGRVGESVAAHVPALIKLLKDKNWGTRESAAIALGRLGEPAEVHVPILIKLLKDKSVIVRESTAKAIGKMGETAAIFVPSLAKLLKDNNSNVRISAVESLGKMGASTMSHIPALVKLLKDDNPSVRGYAAEALGRMGELAASHVPALIESLKDKNASVRESVVKAIGVMGETAGIHAPALVKLLRDKNWSVRESAAKVIAQMGESAASHTPFLVELLKVEDSSAQKYAAEALGRMGESASAHAPALVKLLGDDNSGVRGTAAKAIGRMGESASDYAPALIKLFKDEDYNVRVSAVEAIGNMGTSATAHVPAIVKLLKDNNSGVRGYAAESLGKMGQSAAAHVPTLIGLLKDKDWRTRESAAMALGKMGKSVSDHFLYVFKLRKDLNPDLQKKVETILISHGPIPVQNIPHLLEEFYGKNELLGESRFMAHFMGGGATDSKILLRWLGYPQSQHQFLPQNPKAQESREALDLFQQIWGPSRSLPSFRGELTVRIGLMVKATKDWGSEGNDLNLLTALISLKDLGSSQRDAIQKRISAIESDNKIKQYLKRAEIGLGVHSLFWFIMVVFYPRSRFIQAVFFWNPWFRRLLGFGYVNCALTWIPFLRRKLFVPFKKPMEADAQIEVFKELEYYNQTEIESEIGKKRSSLVETLQSLRGQVILEGSSGLGKTTFLRQWVKHSKSLVVFLPADQCAEGPLKAIQNRTKGVAKDENYLKKLIHARAIDICIDGLNEVSVAVRESIIFFMKDMPGANIIVATQRLEWKPPATAKRYFIKPLRHDQIEEFLCSRRPFLEGDDLVSENDFPEKCKSFLRKVLSKKQPVKLLESAQTILSNPMDLSVVALMLARNQDPDLFRLLEQQYSEMGEDYKATQGRDFPLGAFSEEAYRVRLNPIASGLNADIFEAELLCMERHKMAFNRPYSNKSQWEFRHDKIMEFFVAQTFLTGKTLDNEETTRLEGHLGDSRFNGVYFLLAMLMPLDDAKALKEELVNYAVDTYDNTVLAGFVQNLRSRETT